MKNIKYKIIKYKSKNLTINVYIYDDSLFETYIILRKPLKIKVAKKDQYIYASKRGRIRVTINMNEEVVLEDVLFCEEVLYNLLSIKKMQNSVLSTTFDKNDVHVKKNNKIIMTGKLQISLYVVEFKVDTQLVSQSYKENSSFENYYKLWH